MWIATVSRYLPGCRGPRRGDYGGVYQASKDVSPLDTITNCLRQNGPTENNVAYYRGSFASMRAARQAIRQAFPEAHIDVER